MPLPGASPARSSSWSATTSGGRPVDRERSPVGQSPSGRAEIKRYFCDHGWAVRVPRDLQELTLRLVKLRGTLTGELGRSPTVAEHMVIDETDAGGFGARQAWLYVTILTVGYMVSRGLAKAGSRDPYDADDR